MRVFLALSFIGSAPLLFAQDDPGNGPVIVDIFKANLIDAKKELIRPELQAPAVPKTIPAQTYAPADFQYGVNPVITFSPARKMDKSSEKMLHNNFFKFAFGNNLTPLAEVYFGSTRKPNAQFGAHFRHLSSDGKNITDFADNSFDAFGKRIFKKGEFGMNFYFTRNAFNYYGYDTAIKTEDKDSLRNFHKLNNFYNTIGTRMAYIGNERGKNKGKFTLTGDYHYFQSKLGNRENNVDINTSYGFNVKKDRLLISASNVFNQYGDSAALNARNLVTLGGLYQMKKKAFNLSLGAKVQAFTDTSGTTGGFFPLVNFRYFIDGNDFVFFADVDGGQEMRTFRNTAAINPFLEKNVPLKNFNNYFSIGGGVEIKAGPAFKLSAGAKYMSIKDLPVFVTNDSLDSKAFTILYDNANLVRLNAHAEYHMSEKIFFYGDLTLNNYFALTALKKAYHYPQLEVKSGVSYTMADKLTLKADIFYTGKRTAFRAFADSTVANQEVELKGFIDANLTIDYRIRKNFAVFIMVNNIATARYQRWYNYPVYGFNALGGLSFNF